MKLFILEETFELENKTESVEEIFNYIKQALDETDYNFSYMIVDGEEIYDEFEFYLEDNIKFIEEVKVVMLSTKDLILDNLLTIHDYLDGAIPILDKLSDSFYKEPTSEDWQLLNDLFEGIGFIFHTLYSIDEMENLNEILPNYEIWNEYVDETKSLDDVLKELESGMNNGDTVLIGDLLSYEIAHRFEKMKEKLESLVKAN